MSNTYNWEFYNLDVVPLMDGVQQVVVGVSWILHANDTEGHSAAISGKFEVAYNPGEPFIPYADLTPAEVEGWANEKLQVDEIKAQLDQSIERQANPPFTPMTPPWN